MGTTRLNSATVLINSLNFMEPSTTKKWPSLPSTWPAKPTNGGSCFAVHTEKKEEKSPELRFKRSYGPLGQQTMKALMRPCPEWNKPAHCETTKKSSKNWGTEYRPGPKGPLWARFLAGSSPRLRREYECSSLRPLKKLPARPAWGRTSWIVRNDWSGSVATQAVHQRKP